MLLIMHHGLRLCRLPGSPLPAQLLQQGQVPEAPGFPGFLPCRCFAEVLRVNTLDFKGTSSIMESALNSRSRPVPPGSSGVYCYRFKKTEKHGALFSVFF